MKSVSMILSEGFQIMAPASLTAFEMANVVAGERLYEVSIHSVSGGMLRSSQGIEVSTAPLRRAFADTTIVISTFRPWKPAGEILNRYLRAANGKSRRIASICSGAFRLAEAGLLDGRAATTHWSYAARLQQMHPRVKVDADKIYIRDGKLWTSAGLTAGIDLSIALVEDDHGPELAKQVSRNMIVYYRRPGGQSQFSTLVELEPSTDRMRRVLSYAKQNLNRDLTVDELAEVANLSPRQFSRLFSQETGATPAKAVEKLRLEVARTMIEEGKFTLDHVARDAGFSDRERCGGHFSDRSGSRRSSFSGPRVSSRTELSVLQHGLSAEHRRRR